MSISAFVSPVSSSSELSRLGMLLGNHNILLVSYKIIISICQNIIVYLLFCLISTHSSGNKAKHNFISF